MPWGMLRPPCWAWEEEGSAGFAVFSVPWRRQYEVFTLSFFLLSPPGCPVGCARWSPALRADRTRCQESCQGSRDRGRSRAGVCPQRGAENRQWHKNPSELETGSLERILARSWPAVREESWWKGCASRAVPATPGGCGPQRSFSAANTIVVIPTRWEGLISKSWGLG